MATKQLLRNECYINGQWRTARDGAVRAVVNPATGAALGTVPWMGAAETVEAIDAADRAWPAWRALSAAERAAILMRWYGLMMEHQEQLARIMTQEQGKPLKESCAEIAYAASFLRWFAEEARRTYGEIIPAHQTDKRIMVLKQPVGVCAAITPWNFPSAMITRKLAPALAAGCTIVVKPASQTPLSALALADLAEQAELPPGVFNVITGEAATIGELLTQHPKVRKFTFTGSTETGTRLAAQCAPTVKKVSLELGGNAPFIVFDDADLDAAVKGAVMAKYRNSGQTCICANRILVHERCYDDFITRFTAAVACLKVGDGLAEGVEQGPLIDERAVDKVERCIADALAKGARLTTGGQRHALGGTFFEPTVLADVTDEMKVAQEEIFGPVAPIFRFSSEKEALEMANNTPFGLAAYFYTTELRRSWRVAEALEYGMVGINTGLVSTEVAPFGGVKASGLGREGSHYGIDEFLETKYVCLGGM